MVNNCKASVQREKQQHRVDDVAQDRVVDIARAGQGREHNEGAQQGGG